MRNRTDICIGVITLLLVALGIWGTTFTSHISGTTDPIGPLGFPRGVLCLLALLGCIQVRQGLRAGNGRAYWPERRVLRKMAGFILLFCLYIAMMFAAEPLLMALNVNLLPSGTGFIVSTFCYLAGTLFLSGRKKILEITLVALLVPTSVTWFFFSFFQITLP